MIEKYLLHVSHLLFSFTRGQGWMSQLPSGSSVKCLPSIYGLPKSRKWSLSPWLFSLWNWEPALNDNFSPKSAYGIFCFPFWGLPLLFDNKPSVYCSNSFVKHFLGAIWWKYPLLHLPKVPLMESVALALRQERRSGQTWLSEIARGEGISKTSHASLLFFDPVQARTCCSSFVLMVALVKVHWLLMYRHLPSRSLLENRWQSGC